MLYRVLILAMGLAGAAAAKDMKTPDCGAKGQRACGFFEAEFWANGNGFCDWGLKNSKEFLAALQYGGGTCVTDRRETQTQEKSWVTWALGDQRYGIQGDLPVNQTTTLGTHNSFSAYNDGDFNFLSTNQLYSMTDQLNLGARSLRIDPHYYFDELRLCHAESNATESGSFSGSLTSCTSMAVSQYLTLIGLFTPYLVPIQLLPEPIPFIVNSVSGVAAAAGLYTATIPINNRLYSYGIREIADWLEANPGEFIVVTMNDYSENKHDLLNKPIEKFLGKKVFTPDDLTRYGRWPSLKELRRNGKQVIFFSNKFGSSNTNDKVWIHDFSGNFNVGWIHDSTSGKKLDEPASNKWLQCQDDDGNNLSGLRGKWLQTGEGRTGSDWIGSEFKGLMNEQEVAQAVRCGYSNIRLDFFMALNRAYGKYSRSEPDKRREAAVWSWAEGDFGKAGPATMTLPDGRWHSLGFGSTLNVYACSRVVAGSDTREWNVVRAVGNADLGFYGGQTTCRNVLGPAWNFTRPETARDNEALVTRMVASGFREAWLNYSSVPIPPAFIGPVLTDHYMDKGGAAPDQTLLGALGYPQVYFRPELLTNQASLLNLTSPTGRTSLADGRSPVLLEHNQQSAQSVNSGQYTGSVGIDLFLKAPIIGTFIPYLYGSDEPKPPAAFITTHVMEPTTTALAVEAGPYRVGKPVTLRARVRPACSVKPTDPASGGAIPITGVVQFTDTYLSPAGKVSVKNLGFIPINNSPDYPSDNNDGILETELNNCPTDHVCVSTTRLSPGKHTIAAMYHRDSTYNGSTSNTVEVRVRAAYSPESLSFEYTPGGPVPPPQLLEVAGVSPNDVYNIVFRGNLLRSSEPRGRIGGSRTVDISLNPAGLAPGYYETSFDFYATIGGVDQVYEVPVTIRVKGNVSASATPMQFTSFDQAPPDPKSVMVSNSAGPVRANATTGAGGSWLSAVPAQNGRVDILVNPAGLPAGTYQGQVTLSSPTADGSNTIPVTLQVAISKPSVTVSTNPPGLAILLDGVPHISPRTMLWDPGTKHEVGVPSGYVPAGDRKRAIWQNWSDSGAIRHLITAPAAGTKDLTANFSQQYEFAVRVDPVCSGTVLPIHSWVAAGASTNIAAAAATNFRFVSYSGDVTGTSPSQSVVMTGPKNVTARFDCAPGKTCANFGLPRLKAQLSSQPNADGWYRTDVNVVLAAMPAPSGVPPVTKISWALSGATTGKQDIVGTNATFDIKNEGITTLTYFATDQLGVAGDPEVLVFRIDKTRPSGDLTRTPANAAGWNNTDVTINFKCSDSLSGPTPDTAQQTRTLTNEGKDLFATTTCRDLAGNERPFNAIGINIDKTAPVLTGMPGAACTLPADGTLQTVATIKASDALSGIATFGVNVGTSETIPAGDVVITGSGIADRVVQLRGARSGNAARVYTISASAADKAGKTITATSTCTVAAVATPPPPTGDVTGDGKVDCADVAAVRAALGKRTGQPGFEERLDLVKDGVIDIRDVAVVTRQLPAGTVCR